MSQPLRKYAQTSDEVEHLDNELSESLAKIRADIEVCAFIYRALEAYICLCICPSLVPVSVLYVNTSQQLLRTSRLRTCCVVCELSELSTAYDELPLADCLGV